MKQTLFSLAFAAALLAALARSGAGEDSKPAFAGDPYPLATCPVSGEKLGAMGDAVVRSYDGREVRFCCGGCVGKFEKSRETYFAKIDEKIVKSQRELYPLKECVVSGRKLGAMGDPIQMVVHNRLFLLCCPGCKSKLTKDPAGFFGKLDAAVIKAQSADYPLETCLVSGKKLGAMGPARELVVANRLVRLCCPGCVAKFRKDSVRYIEKLDAARKAKKPAR